MTVLKYSELDSPPSYRLCGYYNFYGDVSDWRNVTVSLYKPVGELFTSCPRCDKKQITPEEYYKGNLCKECTMLIEAKPIMAEPEKICQNCLERGYSPANKATRQWLNKEYVCESCYNVMAERFTKLEDSSVDFEFARYSSEEILENRDQIWNIHNQAIVNLTLDELVQKLEEYKKVLFSIRICAENVTARIRKIKEEERSKVSLSDRQSDTKILDTNTAAAKIKLSKEEKLKKKMAAVLGISVQDLEQKGKEARALEFQSIAEGKKCPTCNHSLLTCKCTVKDEKKAEEKKAQEKKCPLCGMMVLNVIAHVKECKGKNNEK